MSRPLAVGSHQDVHLALDGLLPTRSLLILACIAVPFQLVAWVAARHTSSSRHPSWCAENNHPGSRRWCPGKCGTDRLTFIPGFSVVLVSGSQQRLYGWPPVWELYPSADAQNLGWAW